MAGDPASATNGAPYLVTERTALPTGQVHIRLLYPSGARRGLVLPDYAASEEQVDAIARALAAGERYVRGRRVAGDTGL